MLLRNVMASFVSAWPTDWLFPTVTRSTATELKTVLAAPVCRDVTVNGGTEPVFAMPVATVVQLGEDAVGYDAVVDADVHDRCCSMPPVRRHW